jgi:hypothetical protein
MDREIWHIRIFKQTKEYLSPLLDSLAVYCFSPGMSCPKNRFGLIELAMVNPNLQLRQRGNLIEIKKRVFSPLQAVFVVERTIMLPVYFSERNDQAFHMRKAL